MKVNALIFTLCAFQGASAFTAPRSMSAAKTALASTGPEASAMTQAPPEPMAPPPPPEQPYYAEPEPVMRAPTYMSDQEKIWGAKGGEEWKYSHRSSFEQNPAYIQPEVSFPQARAHRPSNSAYYSGNSRGAGGNTWYHAAYSDYDQNGSGGYENRHRPPYSY